MNRRKIWSGIAITAAAAGLLVWMYSQKRARNKKTLVSEAGFETAYDIYFPLRHNRLKGEKPAFRK